MKRVLISAIALAATLAAPAIAEVTSAPIPAEGITPAALVQLLALHQMAPKLTQGSDGQPVINGRTAGVGFDVSLGGCKGDRCRDVFFKVGWSNAKGDAKLTADRINRWNAENNFLRAYVSSDNTLWAEMDARIARGTTTNVEEYIELWKERLHAFKPFMGL
ncbi:MAG: YbjN domain-containing protein [Stellaceae bacterium]